jgi:predicted DNA-binding transcriptional regulator YafY
MTPSFASLEHSQFYFFDRVIVKNKLLFFVVSFFFLFSLTIMAVDRHVRERYRIIDGCFRNNGKQYDIDDLLEEVNRQLMKNDCQPISKRTLQKDIADMQLEFDFELDNTLWDGRKRIYRYSDTSFSIFSIQNEERKALERTINMLRSFPEPRPLQYDYIAVCLEQLSMMKTLSDGVSNVVFQDNLDYIGREHFLPILKAVENHQPLKIYYKSFKGKEEVKSVFPYQLRQYNERWFLVASDKGYKALSLYALDRIQSIEQVHLPFEEYDGDIDAHFENVIGVSSNANAEIVKVKLHISTKRFPYIETKPLHWSQTEIKKESTTEYRVITLRLQINNELVANLLSLGEDVEIIEPKQLVFRIKEIAEAVVLQYEQPTQKTCIDK